MKIVITGAAGFIGSHIVDRLLRDEHEVYGIDDLSNGSTTNITSAFRNTNFVFLEADYNEGIKQVENPDVIIHLAATGSVPRSIAEPTLTFANNVEGFHNLLVHMATSSVKRLIYASSSSVLGGTDKPNPQSPYAVSKFTNELYAEQFSKHFGITSTGLRFFNVYGPRQRSDTPYSAVIPKMLTDESIKIHAPGTQTRDFTYVKDVVAAVVKILATPNLPTKVYNVGFGHSRTVLELLELLGRLLPERRFRAEIVSARPGDVVSSQCDNQELKKDTGWEPIYSLESGLSDMLFGELN